MKEPQFAGQTKERLVLARSRGVRRRHRQGSVRPVAEPASGGGREDRAARDRQCAGAHEGGAKVVTRKRIAAGPGAAGQARGLRHARSRERGELFLVEGDSAGGSAKQARDREFQAVMPLRGKILNTWEVDAGEVLQSQEVHHISVALGVDPGSADIDAAALSQGLHPRRRRFRRAAHRDAAVRAVPAALPAAGVARARVRRDAAAVSHRCGQAGVLRARRCRARRDPRSHRGGEFARQAARSRASRASAR